MTKKALIGRESGDGALQIVQRFRRVSLLVWILESNVHSSS